ncbi:MAG: hypothetical protein U1E14_15235 [Geminicoccaceae bacterium]
MDAKQSLGQRWDAYKPTKGLMFMGVIAGAIAATAVGFGWGGWVTGGTARSMVDNASITARSELVAAICVDRFKALSDAPAQLVTLKAMQAWDRGSFIEKGGWAAMPDKAEPTKIEAKLCADQLAAL